MSDQVKDSHEHLETYDKDVKSIQSGSTGFPTAPANGIDSEVADFFAASREIVIDEATNVRLRWMVHKRVLVVMIVTYFAQTLDKGTLNFASIMGIREDTNLKGQQYAWLTTCVYIAILFWEYPTNLLLQKLPIAKFLGFNIIAWGAVLACTAACKNFTGLVIVRTLLGIFECICQPAFVFLSTMWYTREEQALVIGSFYSMNGLQQCVGGLLAYGVAHFQGSIKNWQFLFLLLGCLTVCWGIFVLWHLPDSPMQAKCWSPEDRLLIAERVRANNTGIQNKTFKKYQALEALRDPIVWAVVVISFTNALPTGGLGAFSNIILKAFGFSLLQTYLLAIAQGAIIMMFLFSAAFLSKRYNQKLLFAFMFTMPNIAGTIVFMTVPTTPSTKVGLLLAFYCMQGFGAVAILNLAVMTGNVGGRSKQVVATTLTFVAWSVGNAIGPQVFQDSDNPRYIKAFIVHLIMYGVQLLTIVLLRIHLMRRNVLKRKAQASPGQVPEENIKNKHAFEDLTDRENPDFRYVF